MSGDVSSPPSARAALRARLCAALDLGNRAEAQRLQDLLLEQLRAARPRPTTRTSSPIADRSGARPGVFGQRHQLRLVSDTDRRMDP